jgi:hypothetical protein
MKTKESKKIDEIAYTGEMIGYTSRWNIFSNSIKAIVNIEGKARKIPIDNRQIKFLQKEYPPGSMVTVGFNGTWYIKSQPVTDDFKPSLDEVPIFDL